MRIFHIFWREYWSNITRRSYLIFTFGFPVLVVVAPVVGGVLLSLAIFAALPPTDPRPVGLVDEAGLLLEIGTLPDDPVPVRLFDDTQAAAAALAAGQTQATYHVPSHYWQTGQVTILYDEPPTEFVDRMVERLLRQQVRARVPAAALAQLDRRASIEHQGLADEADTFSAADLAEPVIVYLIIYFVRMAGSFTATYMFDSIASEADDRTLEIMITSVSPLQFVSGKLLGLLAVGLTQIGVWGGAILLIAVTGGLFFGIDMLSFLLTWEHLWLMAAVLLATYLMDQILAAAMGLLRVSGGAGNLLFSTFNAVIGIGLIYAAYFVPRNPHTPLAVAASLFPPTAPLVLLIRAVVSQVPAWQIAVSLILLWGTNLAGLLWLRHLLKTNLVAGGRAFNTKEWVVTRLRRLLPFWQAGGQST